MKLAIDTSRRRQIDENKSYVTHSASSSEATRGLLVVIRLPDRPQHFHTCNTAPGNRILSLVRLADLEGQLPVLGSRTFGSVGRRAQTPTGAPAKLMVNNNSRDGANGIRLSPPLVEY